MLCAFSISPIGVGESVSAEVAEVVRLVRESGLPNETNAMFTNVEGEWDEVMALDPRVHDEGRGVGAAVSVVIKIDHRAGVTGALAAQGRSDRVPVARPVAESLSRRRRGSARTRRS